MRRPLLVILLLAAALGIPQGTTTQQRQVTVQGLTGESCRFTAQCAIGRTCRYISGTNSFLCAAGFSCLCLPAQIRLCRSSGQCVQGEVCATYPLLGGIATCVSRITQLQLGLNTREEVCVDARALDKRGLRLVYPSHVMGEVLCDGQDSCATDGHVVVFGGAPMVMRRYCQIVGCVAKRMLVNSPVWKPGLRVSAKTPGLGYTGFAARYRTAAEERILVFAVRMGL